MSTRCNVRFCGPNGEIEANVYKHSDGYPDGKGGMLAELERFFDDVRKQCAGGYGTRFDDPTYLAAKYVVWVAGQYHRAPDGGMLDFIGVGVAMEDNLDSEYLYRVVCHRDGAPIVEYE